MVFVDMTFRSAHTPLVPFTNGPSDTKMSAWRKGDRRRAGKLAIDHGLWIEFPDGDSWRETVPCVQQFLETNGDAIERMRPCCSEMELRIGVTVGEASSFAPTLEFDPVFLSTLARLGFGLTVSAYPTSDDQPG